MNGRSFPVFWSFPVWSPASSRLSDISIFLLGWFALSYWFSLKSTILLKIFFRQLACLLILWFLSSTNGVISVRTLSNSHNWVLLVNVTEAQKGDTVNSRGGIWSKSHLNPQSRHSQFLHQWVSQCGLQIAAQHLGTCYKCQLSSLSPTLRSRWAAGLTSPPANADAYLWEPLP